jgi:acetyl esterase/lipase
VIDSVRAARQLEAANLGDDVVVWGHSQGGNSALWTGMRAGELAPDLKVKGVAALAPASDLRALVAASRGNFFGKIVSAYLVTAYARAYPDVKVGDYVQGPTRLIVGDIAARCVAGYKTLFAVLETMLTPADGIFSVDPLSGPLGARLAENTPTRPFPAPLLVAEGEDDNLVLPDVQRRYVSALCATGQQLEYRTYPGRDHVSLVAADSPLAGDLIQWTRDRFADRPFSAECPS